jgi:hypothetical protein
VGLERTTLSSRRLAVALAGLLVVGLGGGALAATRASTGSGPTTADLGAARATPTATATTPTPTPPTPGTAAPTVPAGGTPAGDVLAADGPELGDSTAPAQPGTPAPRRSPGATPDAPVGPDPAEVNAVLQQAEVLAAQQTAADFAVGYATYRWDDEPGATAERVRPYVTAELYEVLAQERGGNAGRAQLAERQQSAEALVENVQTQTIADGWMDLLVVVRQTVTSTGGAETRWPSYLLRVLRTRDGWRVSGFQP